MVETISFEDPRGTWHDLLIQQFVLHETKPMDLQLARSDFDKGKLGREYLEVS